MTNTIFWNVDTQYDFMRDDGKLSVPGAESIEPNLKRLTEYAREHDIKVVSTRDWHTPASREFSDTPDFVATFPPHCLEGTPGAEYVPATKPTNPYVIDWRDRKFDEREVHSRRDIVISKDAFDVFAGNPHTDTIVRTLKPERAVVYGVATNYCVNRAVQGLLERGVEVYVVQDAIKEIPNCDIKEFMDAQWKAKGVRLTSTDSIDEIVR